eukprot:690953-Pelagomonas_calceolata.AAC.15
MTKGLRTYALCIWNWPTLNKFDDLRLNHSANDTGKPKQIHKLASIYRAYKQPAVSAHDAAAQWQGKAGNILAHHSACAPAHPVAFCYKKGCMRQFSCVYPAGGLPFCKAAHS